MDSGPSHGFVHRQRERTGRCTGNGARRARRIDRSRIANGRRHRPGVSRMSKADRPTKLYFKGEYDATGQPLEWFGGVPSEYDPIPARDLGPDDTALLTEAQWKVL